jgi:hypothetical protein
MYFFPDPSRRAVTAYQLSGPGTAPLLKEPQKAPEKGRFAPVYGSDPTRV